jgi:hypothetical protein
VRPSTLAPRVARIGLATFTLAVGGTPVLLPLLAGKPPDPDGGLTGRYFTNPRWLGAPTRVRVDEEIDFNWWGKPPLLPPFSVIWTGRLIVTRPGLHRFRIDTADAVILEIDGRTVIDTPGAATVVANNGQATLAAGEHPIFIRYMNQAGDSVMKLFWTPPDGMEEIVPAEVLQPDAPAAERMP